MEIKVVSVKRLTEKQVMNGMNKGSIKLSANQEFYDVKTKQLILLKGMKTILEVKK